MGQDTRPVQRWEVLRTVGITIRPEGKGILVEMTVDGAARLVQSLKRVSSKEPGGDLAHIFLEDLVRKGRQARLKLERQLS